MMVIQCKKIAFPFIHLKHHDILKSMELYDNIRKISFWFFVIIGLTHFVAGLLYVNSYYSPYSGIINRVTYIPFYVASYTLFYSQLKHYLAENGIDRRWLSGLLLGIGCATFIVLMGVELFMPDSPTPLIRP